ncbi:MAG: DNA translocase FtsK 4TM domain-containing protein, partial [Rhizomicrobium sp.]
MRGGVYQPRSGWRDVRESFDRFGRTLRHLAALAIIRCAGALQLICAGVIFIAVASYHAGDPSLDNASGGVAANLFGLIGATAADIFLQYFGFAVYGFLLPLFAWGWRALMGRSLRHASWRLAAWLVGTVLLAIGLGALPAPNWVPAGCGGIIGIFAAFQADILG